jgi:Tfp pilus assembly protein PilF
MTNGTPLRHSAGKPASPDLLIPFALVVITVLIYAPAGTFDFLHAYDDLEYVLENPQVRRGITAEGVAWAFTTFHAANWHPLTWISHMLDVEFYGMNAGGHHWTNVWLHVINSLLLFFVLRRMTACPWRSGLVAALFAWHPLHVESVAMIAERKDVLCGFFWMLCMWFYIGYARRPDLKRYLPVMGSYLLGLMSKPMIVTLPFVFLLLDVWPLKRWQASPRGPSGPGQTGNFHAGLIYEKIPLLIPTVAACIVTWLAQSSKGAVQAYPFFLRLSNAVVSYSVYLGKTVWPESLAVFYPFRAAPALWQVSGAVLLLVALSLAALLLRRRRPYLWVGWFWFLGTLVPVIGLVQVGGQAMADRYTYLPLIGIFIVAAWGLSDLLQRGAGRLRAATATAIGILTLLSIVSYRQVQTWADDLTLFRHAVEVTDRNWLAHRNLGSAHLKQGRPQAALQHFEAAIDIQPRSADARFNRALALAALGRREAAVAAYRRALQINPLHAGALNNLGGMLIAAGDLDAGMRYCRKALSADPGMADAHNNLGVALYRRGNYRAAAVRFRKALSLAPDSPPARAALAEVLAAMGDIDGAMRQMALAAGTGPRNPANLRKAGEFFLKYRRYARSAAALADAIRHGGDDAGAYNRLGVALAGQGRYAAAAVFFRTALSLDENAPHARSNLDKALEALRDGDAG